MQFPLTRTVSVGAYLISKFSVAMLIRGRNLFQRAKNHWFFIQVSIGVHVSSLVLVFGEATTQYK